MNGQSISNKQDSRLPALDGLRAIAILLVLVGHHLAFTPIPWVRWFTEKTWIGVDLFFVLSGFLIGGILLDQRPATNYYRVFYLRRFFRIVPLYALLVLPGLLVLGCGLRSLFSGHSLASQSVASMWFCVFFIQNFCPIFRLSVPAYLGPTWSVAVEEQFYLLLPLLVRNCDPGKLLKILIAAILLAPLLRGILIMIYGSDIGLVCYSILPCRWDSLLLGVVCAIGYRRSGFHQWFVARIARWRIAWAVMTMVCLAWLFSSDYHLDPRMAFLGYTVVDAWFAVTLLLAVLNPGGKLSGILSHPFFKPIATVSYGLYLLQSPVMAVVVSVFGHFHIHCDGIGWPKTIAAMVSLAMTGLAAAISWKLLESRMIRKGHQRRYQDSGGKESNGLATAKGLAPDLGSANQ